MGKVSSCSANAAKGHFFTPVFNPQAFRAPLRAIFEEK